MFVYVITCEENGKFYSYAYKMRDSENILALPKRTPSIKTIVPVKTLKKARELVEKWNGACELNGNYMFADAPF